MLRTAAAATTPTPSAAIPTQTNPRLPRVTRELPAIHSHTRPAAPHAAQPLPAIVAPRQRRQPLTQAEQPQAWRERAKQLCDDAGLRYTPRLIAQETARKEEVFGVPTRDRYGPDHVVRHALASDLLSCNCTAGTFGSPCCHAGAVILYLDAREEALRYCPTPQEFARDAYWQSYWAWVEGRGW